MFAALCLLPFGRRQSQTLRFVGGMDQKDSFGSTVDTCCVSLPMHLGISCCVKWSRTLPVVVQRQVPVVPRYAALVVDNSGMARFAGSDAPRAVLAFPAVFP